MFRKFLVRWGIVLGLLFVSTQAHAITMRADVDPNQYVALGQKPRFDSVGALYAHNGVNGDWGAGSGVLIAPDWVLTAGHCISVEGIPNGGGISEVEFYLGDNIFQSSTLRYADAWYTYPGYIKNPGSTGGVRWDVGLVHLSQPVVDVAPAVLFNGEDQIGTHLYIAGFGTPSIAGGKILPRDEIKRAGENVVSGLGDSVIGVESQYMLAYFDHSWPVGSILPLEAGVSPGDSGGGWFNDAGQLVGIGTFYRGDYLNYGSDSGAIRASLCRDWIDNTMASVPEPGTLMLFGSGTLAFLPRLLRRRKVKEATA